MTYEDALEDHDHLSLAAAKRELRKHQCLIIEWTDHDEGGEVIIDRILVSNECDEPDWIDCTPASILGWLGY